MPAYLGGSRLCFMFVDDNRSDGRIEYMIVLAIESSRCSGVS